LFSQKRIGPHTNWATFLQTHLVTLVASQNGKYDIHKAIFAQKMAGNRGVTAAEFNPEKNKSIGIGY
jgi:hypothetical protein